MKNRKALLSFRVGMIGAFLCLVAFTGATATTARAQVRAVSVREATPAEVVAFEDLAPVAIILQEVLDRAFSRDLDFDTQALAWAKARVEEERGRVAPPEKRLPQARVWKLLGRVTLELDGHTPAALDAFTMAAELDPEDQEAAQEKALLEARFEAVEQRLRQAAEERKASEGSRANPNG